MVLLDAEAIEALWESYDALQYHRKRLLFLCRADLFMLTHSGRNDVIQIF